ncbi:MAG: aminoacyl-tRNA hydrolase [Ardenticatenia bacterium]|nr:aminoacyl-tRNA hydrolase [Ardenticatenia bacterium]
MEAERYLVVGLGNPGPQYAHNRHNVGFQVMDVLARRHGLAFKARHRALVAEGRIAGRPAVVAKPMTFMNVSGEAVAELVRAYGVELARLLVVYDDMDLPLGRLRLRPRGGAGGHRGMASVIRALGTEVIARLRVGIGRPPPHQDPATYVLNDFSPQEKEVIARVRQEAADAVEVWLVEGLRPAMDRFNPDRPPGE